VADQQQIAEDEQLLGAELGEQGFEEENGYNKRCGVGKGEVPGDDARAESGMGLISGSIIENVLQSPMPRNICRKQPTAMNLGFCVSLSLPSTNILPFFSDPLCAGTTHSYSFWS
jgi:hypothetical protein